MTKHLLNIARWLIGLTFIFSGFVKGIDPWGLEYKLLDYFHAWGADWLSWAATPASFLLPFAEFMVGVMLIFGITLNISSLVALIFMSFFTPFTLYIALKNPVSDCGCFGDALVITNWQTFFKNLILIVLALAIYFFRNKISPLFSIKVRKTMFGAVVLTYCFLIFWSYRHEPILDFRPYKVGVNIPEAMKMPEGAQTDKYSNTFFYKNLKTNEVKQFTDENYPWQDTLNWKFDSMGESILISKGYTPPIHDFFIQSKDGDNVADFFFQDEKLTFMLIASHLEKSSIKRQNDINQLASWAKTEGYNFICLTSTTGDALEKFKQKNNATYDFLFGDEVTLKTILRSNPGLLLTKKGTILAKWHYNDIPTASRMKEKIDTGFLVK